jgi:hypothetical protein
MTLTLPLAPVQASTAANIGPAISQPIFRTMSNR